MKKIDKILLAVIAVLVVILGIILYQQFGSDGSYYAVYFSTGDIYFGKLSYFPRLFLTDVWVLQKNSDNSQYPFGFTRFDKAFWGPEGSLNLDSKNIVWTAKIKNDSPLAQYFKNPQTFQSQNPVQTQQTNMQPVVNSTSTKEALIPTPKNKR